MIALENLQLCIEMKQRSLDNERIQKKNRKLTRLNASTTEPPRALCASLEQTESELKNLKSLKQLVG